MTNLLTKDNIRQLNDYAKRGVGRNLKPIPNNILEYQDFIQEALATNPKDLDEAKKHIRSSILTEKRILLAKLQFEGKLKGKSTTKYCKGCEEDKPYACSYSREDKRTGFLYYDSRCRDCRRIEGNSDERKERKRELYAENLEKCRKQSRERAKRFREKDREAYRKKKREYYQKNIDKIREYKRIQAREYRARKKAEQKNNK